MCRLRYANRLRNRSANVGNRPPSCPPQPHIYPPGRPACVVANGCRPSGPSAPNGRPHAPPHGTDVAVRQHAQRGLLGIWRQQRQPIWVHLGNQLEGPFFQMGVSRPPAGCGQLLVQGRAKPPAAAPGQHQERGPQQYHCRGLTAGEEEGQSARAGFACRPVDQTCESTRQPNSSKLQVRYGA